MYDKNERKFKTIHIKNIAFTVKIERVLLNDLILNSIKVVRNFLSQKKIFNEYEKEIACNFLSGIVMGDGTIGVASDYKNRQKCFFEIKDPDLLNLQECEKIFNKLSFTTKLYENDSPSRLVVRTNWSNLFEVAYKYRMFYENSHHWEKLLTTIVNRKQFKNNADLWFNF